MKKYNFNYRETYLTESLFDDLEDDLDNSDEVSKLITQINDNIITDKLTEFFNEINGSVKFVSKDSVVECKLKDNILYINRPELYAFHINTKVIPIFLKALYYMQSAGITGITTDCGFTIGESHLSGYIPIDFCNIEFINGVYMLHILPKNLYVPFRIISQNVKPLLTYTRAVFIECDLQYSNTFLLYCSTIEFKYCINIQDYSCCKKINSQLTITSTNQTHLAATKNYTGLPKGTYNVNIILGGKNEYNPSTTDIYYEDTNTLIGIPDSIGTLDIKGFREPTQVLSHFSLEGLPINLIENSTFKFEGFSKYKPLVVLIGPYKTIPKIRSFKIPKSTIKYVLTSGDYYIDCYSEKTGPTKEYNTDNVDSKILKSALDKENKKELDRIDKEEMLLKMIQLGIKYLTPNSKWVAEVTLGKKIITVKATNNNAITVIFHRSFSIYIQTKTLRWTEFLKYIELSKATYKNEKNRSIKSLVINPVVKEYELIKLERKELKKLERLLNKKQSSITKSNDDVLDDLKPNDNISSVKNSTVSTKKPSNIEIVDYSDKAIAIFGNTYDIKDKIKELGGKFNPRLKYKNSETDKRPGWIISKRKQKEIEDLIK